MTCIPSTVDNLNLGVITSNLGQTGRTAEWPDRLLGPKRSLFPNHSESLK